MSKFCWHRGTLSLKGEQINSEASKWLHAVPITAQEQRFKRDESDFYHVTIATATEVTYAEQNGLIIDEILKSMESVELSLYGLGLTKATKGGDEAWYAIVHCEWADCLRERLQLDVKDFHITLGFSKRDLYFGSSGERLNNSELIQYSDMEAYDKLVTHICNKDMAGEKTDESLSTVIQTVIDKQVRIIKYATYRFIEEAQKPTVNRDSAGTAISTLRMIARWCMAQTVNNNKNKNINVNSNHNELLVVLIGDIGYYLLSQGILFGIRLLVVKCKKERGDISTLFSQLRSGGLLPVSYNISYNVNSGSNEDRNAQSDLLHSLNLQLEYYNTTANAGRASDFDNRYLHPIGINYSENQLGCYTLPRNFSWVRLTAPLEKMHQQAMKNTRNSNNNNVAMMKYNELLAGSSYPTTESHIVAMHGVGIRSIITLHEQPFSAQLVGICKKYNINCHYWHVFDRTPPTVEQLTEVCNVIHGNVTKQHGTLVHCQGGVGRTNTAIIAYLMRVQRGLSASIAIETVRSQRKMILSHIQESLLKASWFKLVNSCDSKCEFYGGATTAAGEVRNTEAVSGTPSKPSALKPSSSVTKKSGSKPAAVLSAVSLPSIPTVTATASTVEAAAVGGATATNDSHEKAEPSAPSNTASAATATTKSSNGANGGGAGYRKIASSLQLPPIILLCGTAGSGKSTFSTAMVNAFPDYFVRINKDEMRGKGQCDNLLFDTMRRFNSGSGGNHTGIIILDNCNLTTAARKTWIESVHRMRIWCVYFNVEVSLCKHRVKYRVGHPTIPQGGERGASIIDTMVKQLQVPSGKEGFERVTTLSTEEDVSKLLTQWCIPFRPPAPLLTQSEIDKRAWAQFDTETETVDEGTVTVAVELSEKGAAAVSDSDKDDSGDDGTNGASVVTDAAATGEVKLLKFPRTPHIVNLGAATRDDKVLGLSELKLMVDRKVNLTIEEKLDGANMGISIDPVSQKIMVQNRSHYISAKYHPQFQPLDNWLQNHSQELYSVLIPGRHILYGEWLYATHSVYYNKLPDYFIAYDLYDRVDNVFYSRKRLLRTLAQTSILVSPLIFEGTVQSSDEVLALVQGPSAFIDVSAMTSAVELSSESMLKGQREGIVVRLCERGRLVSRAKLVRHDFIAGNERWNKTSKLATNKLDFNV